jgi:hypothetical protein
MSDGSGERASGDANFSRIHGAAIASRVAGDAADGHIDSEAGGGAFLFGLAAPEAVLALLAGPHAAPDDDRALQAQRSRRGLPAFTGFGSFARRGEVEAGLAFAGAVRHPIEVAGRGDECVGNSTVGHE